MKIGGGISLSKKKTKKNKHLPRHRAQADDDDDDDPFINLPDRLDFEAFAAAAAAEEKRDEEVRDKTTGKKILQLSGLHRASPIAIPPRTRAPSPEVMALDARHQIEAWKRARIEMNKEKFEKGLDPNREIIGWSDDSILDDKKKYEEILMRQEQLKNTHHSESLPSKDVLDILTRGGKRRKKRTKRRKSKGKRKTKRRRKFRFKKKRTKRRKKSRKGRNTNRRRRR
jgi:hypothetical protein